MDRIAAALERIADALEAQNAADPLTMLNAALGDPGGKSGPPQEAVVSNGFTVVYKHPVDATLEVVARRDDRVEGGYAVGVERA